MRFALHYDSPHTGMDEVDLTRPFPRRGGHAGKTSAVPAHGEDVQPEPKGAPLPSKEKGKE